MRVAMHYSNDDVRLEDMSIPQIGPEELLVKVIASGICGSDVMEWYRIRKAPLVLGHEITGEIAEIGSGVKKYKKVTGFSYLIMFLATHVVIVSTAIKLLVKLCTRRTMILVVLQSIPIRYTI